MKRWFALAESIPEFVSIAWLLLQKRKLTQRSNEAMICIGNLKKIVYFVDFLSTYVLESRALFNGDFFMNLNSGDSDEVMKRGDEVLTATKRWSEAMKRYQKKR